MIKNSGNCIEDYTNNHNYKGIPAIMEKEALFALVKEVKDRFTYVVDKDNPNHKGIVDYWSVSKDGKNFIGDCEDFALTVRYELSRRGYDSQIAGVSLLGKKIDHAVLIHGDYIINNMYTEPVRFWEVDMPIIITSGHKDNKWKVQPAIKTLLRSAKV